MAKGTGSVYTCVLSCRLNGADITMDTRITTVGTWHKERSIAMNNRGVICKTSQERGSFELPVSQGCPYNACAFCNLYKDVSYRELPLQQVEQFIARVRQVGGKPKRVMLGEGNAFHMDHERLMRIITMLEDNLPSIREIVSDASIPSIAAKTDQQLAELAAHGYTMVYVGIESGQGSFGDVFAWFSKLLLWPVEALAPADDVRGLRVALLLRHL